MTTAPPDLSPRTGRIDLAAHGVPHPAPFLLDLRVDGAAVHPEIDHVANTEYVRWIDRAAQLHCDHVGWTRERLLAEERMWFVARHEIDYRAEVRGGEELVVATWVRDFHRVRSWRDTVILRPADGEVVCRAATLWVYVDLRTRRPVRIPPDVIERFAPCERTPGAGRGDGPCTSS